MLAIVEPLLAAGGGPAATDRDGVEPIDSGFVYMLKSGRHHKVGRTNAVGRRQYELAIQLPECDARSPDQDR